VRVLSRLFRRRFLEELQQLHDGGKLRFFGEHAALADAAAFKAWLAPLRRCEWVVYAKRPFAGPQAVLAYLSRYTHRVAISNSRLLAMDERGVTFRWKDYRAKGKTRHKAMTLSPQEFMRRFLLHVLPGGFHRIRHYGLLANSNRRDNLALARELLQATPPPPAESADDGVGPHRRRPSCARTAATRWWCCRSSCATARFGRRQHHDDARSPHRPTRRRPWRPVARCARRLDDRVRPAREPLPRRSGSRRPCQSCVAGAASTRRSRAAGSQARQRRPIAIAAALNAPWRSPRFPPSRLMQHLPGRSEGSCDRLRVRAGVTQALT
jgi:hypothetical protein